MSSRKPPHHSDPGPERETGELQPPAAPSQGQGSRSLRSRAEARLASEGGQEAEGSISQERMHHELSVHQIELEMQNEELKRSHQELEHARSYLEGLFKHSPLACVTLDEDHRIVEANPVALEIFRFPSPLQGVDLDSFLSKNHQALLKTTIGRALRSGERQSCELQYAPFSERTLRWMRLHCAPLIQSAPGRDAILLCTMEDITTAKNFEQNLVMAKNAVESEVERRTLELQQVVETLQSEVEERCRAEQAWRASEARYRHLVDQLPALVYTATPGGQRELLFLSRQAESMLGYSAEELMAGPEAWFEHVAPEDVEGLREELQRCHREQRPLNVTYRFVCKSGDVIWLQDQAALVTPPASDTENPLFTPQVLGLEEERPHLQGILFDVTEKMRLDDELLTAKQRAEAANEAKSEFLANMSHEVRTPLNGVLGMLQLLQLSPLSEEQEHFVNLATESGKSLLRVINDILDFSKVEAGKLELVSSPFSIHELVQGVAHVFKPSAQSKGLRFLTEVDEKAPQVLLGDDARLRQILYNLLGNAVKFTESGEVACVVAVNGESADGSSTTLRIQVRDTGVGIPKEQIAKIFEPFTQIDSTFTRRHQGTGLGLGIVKRLVELMGGALHVESELGAGSTFELQLPFTLPASRPAVPQAMFTGSFTPLRVLVAEDNEVNMMAACRMLESMGHDVQCASNGMQALEALAAGDYHCVLLDVQMPELDGLGVTRTIRTTPPAGVDSNVYIIAMTAHAMSGDRERFLEAGMDDYIAKPVDMQELQDALMRAASRLQL